MGKRKIEKAVKMILEAVGEDPQKVTDFYEEILAWLSQSPRSQIKLYSIKRRDTYPDECL
jgi:GTP cyclohydrolase I